MIRIKKNRCGYSGYSCTGVQLLDDVFAVNRLVADTLIARTVFDDIAPVPGATRAPYCQIDNYQNLPVKVTGMVTTTSPVLDMDAQIDPPEAVCRVELNPLTPNGFLDLYTEPYSDRVIGKYDTDAYTKLSDGLLAANNGNYAAAPVTEETERVLFPGIQEPMLDTDFSPIGVDAQTSFDASLDGVMMAMMMLTKWRKVVENNFNSIRNQLTHIGGLRNLLLAMNESDCDDFKIYQTNADVARMLSPYGLSGEVKPTFRVKGGDIKINGKTIKVKPLTKSSDKHSKGITPGEDGVSSEGFTVYLNVQFKEDSTVDTAELGLAPISLPGFSKTVEIGKVKRVDSEDNSSDASFTKGSPHYAMYVIIQRVCEIDEDALRVAYTAEGEGGETIAGGFLFMETKDNMPAYTVIPAESCDEEDTTPTSEPPAQS